MLQIDIIPYSHNSNVTSGYNTSLIQAINSVINRVNTSVAQASRSVTNCLQTQCIPHSHKETVVLEIVYVTTQDSTNVPEWNYITLEAIFH